MASDYSTGGISRRDFLRAGALLAFSMAGGCATMRSTEPIVQTVLGPIPVANLGVTLVHEHVLCDFIGAEKTGRHRWEVEEVMTRMRPLLLQLKDRGVTGFADCTPAFIGRDPRVLKQLAKETGLHILTNTGYYGGAGDKFVPKLAYNETPEQLANRWSDEWENGIEGTGVKPGFIKTGIDEIKSDATRLSAIDEKLVRAAALASKRSGLSVTCHTGGGTAGLVAAKLFAKEGADPARFVVAHSDGHGLSINRQVAELGSWVSFDGISRRPLEEHLALVQGMVEKHAHRLLLSHDNGWYSVGEANGGAPRDYNYIPDVFLPALRQAGLDDALIRKLTIQNPAKAFAIGTTG